MKALFLFLISLLSLTAQAGFVGFQCDKNLGEGTEKAQFALSTENVELKGNHWSVTFYGKEIKNLKGRFVEANGKWIYLFTEPKSDKGSLQLEFVGPAGCQDDGETAWVKSYLAYNNGSRVRLTDLKCHCYAD